MFQAVLRRSTSTHVPFPRVFRAIEQVLAPSPLADYTNRPKITLTMLGADWRSIILFCDLKVHAGPICSQRGKSIQLKTALPFFCTVVFSSPSTLSRSDGQNVVHAWLEPFRPDKLDPEEFDEGFAKHRVIPS